MKLLAMPIALVIFFVGLFTWAAEEADMGERRAVVSIGDGVTSKGDLNGKELLLTAALEALPPSGGVINILPGSYEVVSPHTISIPNVTLAGAGGSTKIAVKSSQGSVDFLQVERQAAGFVLRDCAFTWSPADGERSLVLCGAGNVRVQNCGFFVEPKLEREGWASFLNFSGAGLRTDVWVSGNQFSLGSWCRGVRFERMVSIHVTGNRFEGNLSDPCEGVYVRDCNQQQYAANSFNAFGKRNGRNASVGLFVDNVGGDVGHLEIAGNHFHTFFGSGTSALKCVRMVYATVTGNVFGRVQGWGNSAIHLSDCRTTAVVGNQIENNDGGDGGIVLLLTGSSTGISITSNNFSDNYVTEMAIEPGEIGRVAGTAFLANTFDGRAHPHERAVVVKGQGFASLFIANNTFNDYGEAGPILFDEQEGVIVKDNLVLSPVTKETLERINRERRRKFGPPSE